jgi:dihydroflavonol-4-reductase
MKVLVAGASGFLGLAVVRALAAAGHDVVGLVRSEEKGRRVRAEGGRPMQGDILNLPSLIDAARGCDGLVHVAASATLASRDLGQSDAAKVRVDGAYNLAVAARRVEAKRFVLGSGTWLVGDHPDPIVETTPVKPTGTSMFNWQAERAALESNRPGSLEVVVLRPGMVYGSGGWFRDMVADIRAGRYRLPGPGANRWSPLHLDDCAEAFRTALGKGKGGEVYNVVDDGPVALREFVDFVADLLRVDHPASMTLDEARQRLGEATANHLAANQVVSNAKLKALGWRPRFGNYRIGVPLVINEMLTAAR